MSKKTKFYLPITCGDKTCTFNDGAEICSYAKEKKCSIFGSELELSEDSQPLRCKECKQAEYEYKHYDAVWGVTSLLNRKITHDEALSKLLGNKKSAANYLDYCNGCYFLQFPDARGLKAHCKSFKKELKICHDQENIGRVKRCEECIQFTK